MNIRFAVVVVIVLWQFTEIKLALGLQDSKTQISKFTILRPALFFASSRFSDSGLQCRDFETRLKCAETYDFSRTILYPLLTIEHILWFLSLV